MIVIFSFIVLSVSAAIANSENAVPLLKCCDNEYILNDHMQCTKDYLNITTNATIFEDFFDMANEDEIMYSVCIRNETEAGTNDTCVDILANGTHITLTCDLPSLSFNDTLQECDNIYTTMKFWGATTVIFAVLIYNVPFILVVIIYCVLPDLRTRAYDKAVMSYNLCYMIINFMLIALGFFTMCHEPRPDIMYQLFGFGFMFFVQGSVVWLFIICFDMTLVITRFRWAPKGGADRGREERRKFWIYAAWGWGVPLALTTFPLIAEFTSIFPEDSPIRPNFQNFNEPNIAVIAYVITGPALVCLTNTCLFIYTTVKTIAVQRSTAIINENRKNNVKKRYILFLKLYLMMDTPWLTSALGAIYQDLWILKFIKMCQPIILLILIVPRKRMIAALRCHKVDHDDPEAVGLKDDARKERNNPTTKKMNNGKTC